MAAAFGAYLLLGKKKQPASNASNIAVNSNVNNGAAQEGVSTPVDWQKRYFGNERCQDLAICGDSADPDHDGLTNVEYGYKTDPNNPDSDSDGLADGDEVHAFGSSPLTGRTYSSGQYNDADFVKGGYDTTTNEKFTPEKLTDIKSKIAQSGLHQPTISTLGTDALAQYGFVDTSLNTKRTVPASTPLWTSRRRLNWSGTPSGLIRSKRSAALFSNTKMTRPLSPTPPISAL